jgi:histidinol-phosphate aminotransferase
MKVQHFTRRQFTASLGAGLGAALATRLARPGSDEAVAFAARPRYAPEGAVRLDSNENPYGPSARALEALTRSQRLAGRYLDDQEGDVTEALAKLHGVDPERIVLGCGSGEILRMADMAFLGPGRTVVVAEPTFEAVLGYATLTRAEAVKLPLTADFRHDLPRMAAACDERTGLVYVCNPNNPTGTIVRGDELVAFLTRVPRSAVVVVDEAYHHFVEDPRYRSAADLLEQNPNLVLVRTFSKIYGLAGMRLGYAVASKANADALRAQGIWSNANAGVLEAALASLGEDGLVESQRRRINDARRWLCARLEEDHRRYIPSETNFLMFEVGADVKPLVEAFRARNILVGRRFPSLSTWLRVSIGTPGEMEAFVAALRELVPVKKAVA